MSNQGEVEQIEDRLTAELGQQCGTNSDWCVAAWHVGPGEVPNVTSGDCYVLDNEDGKWVLVVRTFEDGLEGDVEPLHVWPTPAALLLELNRQSGTVRAHLLAKAVAVVAADAMEGGR